MSDSFPDFIGMRLSYANNCVSGHNPPDGESGPNTMYRWFFYKPGAIGDLLDKTGIIIIFGQYE